MATQKLYAGAKLRDIRTRLHLTQKDFAAKLGISLPYLNQMENNNRPVSTTVVLALAQEFGFDVTELGQGDAERLVTDMREALADPVFGETTPQLADLRLTASNAPVLARAFLALHRAYRQTHERLASLDEALGREGAQLQPSPWEEVRDFFHYCDNYIDAVDRAAEHFAQLHAGETSIRSACIERLEARGITVRFSQTSPMRAFDDERQELVLSSLLPVETQTFQLLVQVALFRQNQLLEATLDLARFQSEEARAIAKLGLANYFAGAAMMPYKAFLAAAQETRHDLELLAARFGASIEQVAHRLSTLQRPGAKGVPFFLSASIRQARSPSAIPPRDCNLPALGVPVLCGTSTARLKRRAGSCANWRKRRTGCAISALHGMCPRPAGISVRPCAATRSLSAAKCATPPPLSMPMIWISPAPARSNPSGSVAESVSEPIATKGPFRHWKSA